MTQKKNATKLKPAKVDSKNRLFEMWNAFRSNKPLFWSVVMVIGWRLLLELDNQLFPLWRKPVAGSGALLHLNRWAHWDGGWYMDVATHGYHYIHIASGQENFVFFPIFPVAAHMIARVLHASPLYVGLMLNLLLTIGTAYFLYRISSLIVEKYGSSRQKEHKDAVAIVSVISLLLYPASLFFAAFYSEGFLILGATAAVYYALVGRFLYAGLYAGLATGSKSLGLTVLPALAVIALEQWIAHRESLYKLVRNFCYVAVGLWGIVAYSVYLAVKFSDPLLPYKFEKAWGREKGFFLTNLIQHNYAHIFQEAYFGGRFNYGVAVSTMVLPFIVLGVGIWIYTRYKTFWPLVLGFFVLALPLSTGIMQSLNRYVLMLTPTIPFIILAVIGSKVKTRLLYTLLLFSGMVLLYLTAGFLQGQYFAG